MQEEETITRIVCPAEDESPSGGFIAKPLVERLVTPNLSYEAEALAIRIQKLIDQNRESRGARAEVEMLSRLLVDLHDGGVGVEHAEKVVGKVEAQLSSSAGSIVSSQPSGQSKTALAIVALVIIVGVLACTLNSLLLRPASVTPAAAPPVVSSPPSPSAAAPAAAVPPAVPAVQADWSYFARQSVAPESFQRSLNGDVPTNFLLKNSTSRLISVYWIDYSGNRKFYFSVRPGSSHRQETFASHPWEVVDGNGNVLLYFDAGGNPNEVIDLEAAMKRVNR